MQKSAPAAQLTPDQPCIDCLEEAPATGRRPGAARRAAFWLMAAVLTSMMLGTTLPTPLYVIWQAQWHFAAVLVTVIFAVYAVAVLAALLFAGRSSDQAGRKPVLAVALGCSALSTIVFILAPDVGLLFVGRILSGLSAGLTTGTATAALTELAPASARPPGIAGGHGGQHVRPGPGPPGRRAVCPVRARPNGPGVRGLPGGAGGGWAVPVLRPRDREPASATDVALRRPRHPRAGPGRVHRGRRWPGSPPSP